MDFSEEQMDALAAAVMARLTSGAQPATKPAPAPQAPPTVTMDSIKVGMTAADSAAVRAEILRVMRGGQ